jgi:hypothetical protein
MAQSILRGAAVFAGLAILTLALVSWRLAKGPVSLGPIVPRIEEALTPPDSPYSVKLDNVTLGFRYTTGDRMRGTYLRAMGVSVIHSGDGSVLTVPEMSIKISTIALLRGVIAPTEVEIIKPSLHLVLTEGGSVGLRLGGGEEEDARALLLRALTYLTSPVSKYARLSRISIRDARVAIDGKGRKEGWRASGVDFSLRRTGGGLIISTSGDATPKGARGAKAAIRINGTYPGVGKASAFKVEFSGLEPAAFAHTGGLEALAALKIPIEGSIEVEMNGDGRIDGARFELSSAGGVVEPPIVPIHPSQIKNLHAKGYVGNSLRSLAITDFYAVVGGAQVSLSAHLKELRNRPRVEARAELKGLSVDELKHYWQGRFLPGAYRWVQENVLGGRIEQAAVSLTLERGEGGERRMRLESIEGRGEYSGGSCKCMSALPPLRDAMGTISFTKDRFGVEVAKGKLGGITIDSGTALITGIADDDPVVHITASAEGVLKEAIAIAKRAGARLELPVPDGGAGILGTFSAKLTATFPVHKTPSLAKEVAIRADISGAETTLSIPGGGRLSGGEMELNVEEREGNEKRTLFIKKALLQSPLGISGDVSGEVTLTATDGTIEKTSVLLDLKEAGLAVPLMSLQKPPGMPANLALSRSGAMSEGWEFKLLGSGLSVEGIARVTASGTGFEQITFTRFLVGATDIRGTIEKDAEGVYDINAEGKALDGENLLRSLRLAEGTKDHAQGGSDYEPPEGHSLPPLRLDTRLERVTLGGDRQIENVSGRAEYDGRRWRSIVTNGTLKNGKEIALHLLGDSGQEKLTLTSEDAGEVLRLFDLYGNISGGRLKLDADLNGEGVRGKVVIEDYKLAKAPVLTRLLTLASFTGIVNLISGEGIEFKRLEAPFTQTGKTVEVRDAIAWGDSIGISARRGLIHLDKGTLEFEGFVVPAYTLTRVVGMIPVLGKVITGGKLSGIIAVGYKLSGKMENPNISVNPMSILAPGILKGFVNALEGLAGEHDNGE